MIKNVVTVILCHIEKVRHFRVVPDVPCTRSDGVLRSFR